MSAVGPVPTFRALAIGFYGAPNVGDEVLLDILVHRVHELGGELVVASIDPVMTRRMHAVESIQFANIGDVGRALLHCDVLIMGGGGIFQDHHPFNLDALYLPYVNDISGYARPMLLAQQFGVPVIVWGHGVGPLRQNEPRALVSDLFEKAFAVSVRDEASLALLRDIGVRRAVEVAPDPGWLFAKYHPVPVRVSTGESPKVLALVLREWEKGVWKPQLIEGLRRAVPADWSIQWIAFQAFTEGSGALSDLPLMEEFRASLGDRPLDTLETPATPEEAWKLLSRADAVFSMRLHASVLALLAGRPTCGLEYDDKLAHAHDMASVPAMLRLRIGDTAEKFEASIRSIVAADWAPSRQRIAEIASNASRHLELLDGCLALPKREVTFDAGRMDWLSVWLQQSLREMNDVSERSRLAHELLAYRDLQLASRDDELRMQEQVAAEAHERLSDKQALLEESDASLSSMRSENKQLSKRVDALTRAVEESGRVVEAARTQAREEVRSANERNRTVTDQYEARLKSIEKKLHASEVLLADTRDELDQKNAYVQDKEIYIAMLRKQVDELQAGLEAARAEVVEARDLWRRLRMGGAILRRDLLRLAAAPFTLVTVWRRYGLRVALQQIPRRIKELGSRTSGRADIAAASTAPVAVRVLRRERLLVLGSRALHPDGWPTRALELTKAGERAGFHARICCLDEQLPPAGVEGEMHRLFIDEAACLNDVRNETTRVLLADASERAVALACSAHERGAEIIVDLQAFGAQPASHPAWGRLQAIASHACHAGSIPEGIQMQVLPLLDAADNEVFDSYKTYPAPAFYSKNRGNVLILDYAGQADAVVDGILAADHNVHVHVRGAAAPGASSARVKFEAQVESPRALAPLLAHATAVVVLGTDGGSADARRRVVLAALLLERPVLVNDPSLRVDSTNLHLIDPSQWSAHLALQSNEDYLHISANTWLSRLESLMRPAYPESVSAVVLIHNNRRIVERCIRTLLDHAGTWLNEIVVVDNQSSDGGPELVEELFGGHDKVKLVRNSENGCSSGRNLGVKSATGNYIAFFDSDQWLTAPTCFPEAVSILNLEEGVGAIGWNAGWFDPHRDDLGGPISDYIPNRGMNAEALAMGYRDDIGFLGTSCMFMTKELFERIDGFDTFYDPTCFEDTDICFQIKRAGYSVAFRDLAGVRHQPHQTTGASEGSERYRMLFNRNAAYFKSKWQGFPEFFVDLKSWH